MKTSKKIAGTVLCLWVSSLVFAQTRGLGVKKAAAKTSETEHTENQAPTIDLQKNQICNVYSIAYSPDGNYIAAGYNNSLISIWNIKTGALVRVLKGHKGIVWSVTYSPDGKLLISGSADHTIKYWNPETGELLKTLKGHTGTVSFVTFSTNGANIASGSIDKTVRFWETSTGKLLQTLKGHTDTIASISYSKSGQFVASASWDKTVKVYYSIGGIEKMTLTGHTGAVYAVNFSPDEKQLATGSADKTIKIWNMNDGSLIRTIPGYSGEVWAISYSPDGKFVSGGSSDGAVKVWNVETGSLVYNFTGHTHEVRSICYSANGKYLCSGDSAGMIKMWDIEKGVPVATLLQCSDGEWVTWTPDGYLNGSEGALKELSYTVNGKQYSLEELKETVFQPAVVAAKLTDTDTAVPVNIPTLESALKNSAQPLLKVDVTNTDGSPRTDNKGREVSASIQITDTGSGIGRVFVKLNGRSIQIAESVESTTGDTVEVATPTPLSLRSGKNTVSVSVYDKKNQQETTSNTVELSWQGKTEKSRLFILAAGIDTYSDPSVPQLSNCAADASALVDVCSQYSGDLYSTVFTRKIVNSDVTRRGLLNAITEFGKAVMPDDVFILYLAGHGITHTDGDYYFIPSDYKDKGSDPIVQYGVSKWQIIDALSGIKAQNMTIILDTCNSASFSSGKPVALQLEGLDKNAIIDRFAAKAGYDLLAACSTYQVAVDNYNGHGVFTNCLLEAIQGKADIDRNAQITSTELALYVIKEVPVESFERFGYKQEPQRSLPLFDYPMFGKKNPQDPQSIKNALDIARIADEEKLSLEDAEKRLHSAAHDDKQSAETVAPPENVKVASVTENSVTLSWDEVEGVSGYKVYYTSDETAVESIDRMIPENNALETTHVVSNLEQGRKYYFRVTCTKGIATSVMSETVSAVPKSKQVIIPTPFNDVAEDKYKGKYAITAAISHSGVVAPVFSLLGEAEGLIWPKGNGYLYVGLPLYFYPFDLGLNLRYNWYFVNTAKVGIYIGSGIDLSFRHVSFPVQAGILICRKLDIRYQTAWNCCGYFEDTVFIGWSLF